jgi:hypothetical protein
VIADQLKDDNRALAKREAQLEQLQRDTSGLPRREDLARSEILNGSNPRYVAMKYGLDVERCEKYRAALDFQQEQRRERQIATSSD